MRRVLFVFLFLFLFFPSLSFSGIYKGLEPGLSKKSDADRILGKPIREMVKDERYEYDPKGTGAQHIIISFNKQTQVIDGIEIHPQKSVTKGTCQKWLGLKVPAMTQKHTNGNLVEYYVDEGIALLYSGPQDTYPIEIVANFNPHWFQTKFAGEKTLPAESKMEAVKKIPEKERPSQTEEISIVLIEDTFESENGRKGQLNYTGFKNWDVIQGSVDLIGLGFWDFFPEHGLYVDLDGSTGQAGTMRSKKICRLEPGKYRLEFDLAGTPLSGPNTVTVTLGRVYNEVFTLAKNEPFRKIIRNISVSLMEDARLIFQHAGGDNEGLLLDNIRLARVSTSPQRIGYTLDYYEEAATEAVKTKDCANLKRILDEGLQHFPESSRLWNNRSVYYFSCKSEPEATRREEMLRSARRAYQIEPSNPAYAIDLGWIYQAVFDDCSSAVPLYEKGVKEYGQRRPDLYYHMGSCYEKMGNVNGAFEYYNRLLHAAPNHQYAAPARERIKELKSRYPGMK